MNKKAILLVVVLALSIWVAAGCDSGGGKIQPLSGQGGAAKTGAGPHPMPGSSKGAGN
jgi:hypothetical protein